MAEAEVYQLPTAAGPWTDFVTDWCELTTQERSPHLFRLWCGIALVAGSLERRVWARNGLDTTYPNLFTLLVGPPGTGKFIIEKVRDLWGSAVEPGTKTPAFKVAPDSMTKASLMDSLVKAKTSKMVPKGPMITYHSLLIAAEEMGVLLPDYDQGYIHSLNSIFNNKPLHEEVRRTGSVRELKIENPQINLLGGVQPSYLASTFPEEAWSTGFARRVLMIYSSEPTEGDLFFEPSFPLDLKSRLVTRLGQLSALYGQCKWTVEAVEWISDWDSGGRLPIPSHSKLVHYNRSRRMFAIKLAIISAISRTGLLVIEQIDVKRAVAWLTEAEALMPDVFREMVGRSDSQVIEELHYFVTSNWAKSKQKPVPGRAIYKFLSERVPSDKIERIIQTAERANIIARVAGTEDLWLPRPKIEHGVE